MTASVWTNGDGATGATDGSRAAVASPRLRRSATTPTTILPPVLLVASMGLVGCLEKTPPLPLGVDEMAWPFRPVAMSFHPLSRADSLDAATTILLRIDFRDADGDPVKAIGRLEIAVEATTATPPTRRWTFDLTDPEENRALFDPVTLAYRVRLKSPWEAPPAPGDAVRLIGRLSCGERRLDASADVVW